MIKKTLYIFILFFLIGCEPLQEEKNGTFLKTERVDQYPDFLTNIENEKIKTLKTKFTTKIHSFSEGATYLSLAFLEEYSGSMVVKVTLYGYHSIELIPNMINCGEHNVEPKNTLSSAYMDLKDESDEVEFLIHDTSILEACKRQRKHQ